MKKLLILILIVLLIVLSVFIVLRGVRVGNVEVLSIKQIRTKSEELDDTIMKATKLATTDYQKSINTLNEDYKKLEKEKQNYNDLTIISSDGEIQSASQIEKYELESLWVQIGSHAKSEGAIMKMDIVKGTNTIEDTYNLNFTVTGSYVAITSFVSDIENDSKLGFKIEEFKLVPGDSTSNLKATFVCKDIGIKEISSLVVQNTSDSETQENQKNSNTSGNTAGNTTNSNNNTTTTNSTQNTTNTTNKTNS